MSTALTSARRLVPEVQRRRQAAHGRCTRASTGRRKRTHTTLTCARRLVFQAQRCWQAAHGSGERRIRTLAQQRQRAAAVRHKRDRQAHRWPRLLLPRGCLNCRGSGAARRDEKRHGSSERERGAECEHRCGAAARCRSAASARQRPAGVRLRLLCLVWACGGLWERKDRALGR